MPTPEQVEAFSDADVLFIAMGDSFSVGVTDAVKVIKQLPTAKLPFPRTTTWRAARPWKEMKPVSRFINAANEERALRELDTSQVTVSDDTLLRGGMEVRVLEFEK